jgi:mRNA-degrading endonuclease toxin of MazEF toxin-antitoxin module
MKNFTIWHDKKSKLDLIEQRPHFHEREVWYASLGLNIGFEQDGKGTEYLRPVLIIRKFNNDICWVVPLTHTLKDTVHYAHITVLDKSSTAILSQLKLLDVKRFSHMIDKISDEDFKLVTKKLKELIP